ncbi:hypothetical protein ACFL27_20485 [candidate division CSSED10-310 bacterium]|uniref:Tetratricopeptide repeat protein n=1 Tax=candidate division CSSED10-310 bacterium TaxID=2855610 RepID=A0ABV6Z2A2_UNCC1
MRQYISLHVLEGKKYYPEKHHDAAFVSNYELKLSKDLSVLSRYDDNTLKNLSHALGLSVAELSIPATHITQLEPKERHDLLLLALHSWFTALGVNNPTVVTFEDFHWADPSTLEVLEWFIKQVGYDVFSEVAPKEGCGMVVILLARPELDTRWELCKSWPGEKITLHTLGDTPVADLARNFLQGTVSEEIVRFIVKQAGGNPYHVEELIKYLLETKSIVMVPEPPAVAGSPQPHGRWKIQAGLQLERQVPLTLSGVLGARFDSLPPPHRQVLTGASVIGRTFWENLVSLMIRKVITNELELLKRRELVFGRAYSEMPGDNEYVFKHALFREVVYNRLTKKDRLRYHRTVIEILDRILTGPTRSSLLALKAWHQENSGIIPVAMVTYTQAAEKALAEGSPEDGLLYLEKSIAFLSDPMELPDQEQKKLLPVLMDRKGDILQLMGRYELAAAAFASAIEHSMDKTLQASCTRKKANILATMGDLSGARQTFEAALILADGQPLEQVRILNDLSYFEAKVQSKHEEAQRYCDQALHQMESLFPVLKNNRNVMSPETLTKQIPREALMVLANTFNRVGIVSTCRGDLERGIEFCQKDLDLSHEIGDQKGISRASGNIGVVSFYQGDLDQALKYNLYGQALSLAQQTEHAHDTLMKAHDLARKHGLGLLDRQIESTMKRLSTCGF